MTALAAALSLQDKAQQYGSYAGIAAVFGLGVLSLLYFAQAREVKRLREWAGRAPERAAELEARAVAAAEEKLASDGEPVAVPVPAAAGAAAVAAGNGAPAVVAPATVPPEVAPVPAVPASAVPAGGGPVNGSRGPAPATAAARGGERLFPGRPAPVRASASSATVPPPRTAAGAAGAGRARRGGPGRPGGAGRRAVAYGAFALAVAAAAVAAVLVFVVGGDDGKPAPKPNTVAPVASAGRTTSATSTSSGGTAATKVDRGKVRVAVLNGTTFTGLARSASDKLTKAGFQPGTVTNDTTNQSRSATAVFYADNQKNAALVVAKLIGIGRDAVQPLDANTRAVAGQDADVVVSVGADQAR